MSKTLSSDVKYWTTLENKYRVKGCLFGGLDGPDSRTFLRALILNCSITDELLLVSGLPSAKRDYDAWFNITTKISPAKLVEQCKVLFSIFTNLDIIKVRESEVWTYKRFKHAYCSVNCQLLFPVKDAVVSLLNGDNASFLIINQFLTGFTRVNLPSIDYSKQSLEKYLDREQLNRLVTYPNEILSFLNLIMKEWSVGATVSEYPRHGKGACARVGKAAIATKYEHVYLDGLLKYSYPEYTADFPSHDRLVGLRECQVTFVPKSATSWRTISQEPVNLMFFQQSLRESIYKFIRSSEVLRDKIPIYDPSINCRLACVGSVPNSDGSGYATIDLSDASDAITWRLVKAVFSHTPWYRFLLATRSRVAVLPNGSKLELTKFAPMGSAVCFPVMSMVLSACCECIVRTYGDHRGIKYSVYGDDIVLPDYLAGPLITLLTKIGLVVNKTKTAHGSSVFYRESCGKEYFCGVDVTPLKLPRNFVDTRGKALISNPAAFTMNIDLINRLLLARYRVARSLLLNNMLSLPEKVRPLFTDDGRNGSILSVTPTNHHIPRNWDDDLQGYCYTHGGPTPTVNDFVYVSHLHDPFLYYEWLKSNDKRTVVEEPSVVVRDRKAMKIATQETILS